MNLFQENAKKYYKYLYRKLLLFYELYDPFNRIIYQGLKLRLKLILYYYLLIIFYHLLLPYYLYQIILLD